MQLWQWEKNIHAGVVAPSQAYSVMLPLYGLKFLLNDNPPSLRLAYNPVTLMCNMDNFTQTSLA